MKRLRSILLYGIYLFFLAGHSFADGFGDKTIIIPRSIGINAARQLVGWQDQINLCTDENNGAFSITAEYMRSKNCREITRSLLGTNKFVFSGSLVENRGANDILADYFGLSLDFKSTVCFKPFMSNFVVEFDLYYGLDCLAPGLYFTMYLPIVHDNWSLELHECVSFAGTATTPAGYMSNQDIQRSNLPRSAREAFEGTTTFGDMKEPLKYGRIFGREERSHISDVQLALGYNFFLDTWYHLGLNARLYLPTGNCVQPQFLFNPITGDARHWQAGVGFSGHVDFADDYCINAGLYLDANFTHLFPCKQLRSYDLKLGRGSRYMLLETFGTNSSQLFINGQEAPNQYTGALVPAINQTTLCSTIKVNLQADVALKLALMYESYTLDLGYGVWYRSKEVLNCRQKFPSSRYTLKGDAQLYGFTSDDQSIALNTSQHNATLHGGQGATNFVAGQQLQNLNADNPAAAQGPTAGVPLLNITSSDATLFGYPQVPVQTSNPAIFVTDSDINEQSALAPHALSQKFFLHANKTWYTECSDDFVPFLGIGAEIECKSIFKKNSALSQWGIWVKGGLGFS